MSSSFRRASGRRLQHHQQQHQTQPEPSSLKTESQDATTSSSSTTTTTTTTTTGSTQRSTHRLRGTRPWTNGITLTSMGVRDVDSILGGGQPLGSCILLEEDRWTLDFALSLVRYWCAEAISQEQYLWIPIVNHRDEDRELARLGDDYYDVVVIPEHTATRGVGSSRTLLQEVEDLLQLLPRNLHWDKQQQKDSIRHEQQQHEVSGSLETLMEGDDDDDVSEGEQEQGEIPEDDEEGLQIAWQYRKSVQQQRLGQLSAAAGSSRSNTSSSSTSNIFCHSYDLSGQMTDQKLQSELLQFHQTEQVPCCEGPSSSMCSNYRTCGYRLFQQLLSRMKALMKQHTNQVIRLLLYRIDSCIDMMSVALPLLLSTIRQNEWPVVILGTIQSWKMISHSSTDSNSSTSLLSLRRTCDVVLQLEAFAARRDYPPPPEFRHFHGVMVLQKLAPTSVVSGHFAQTMLKPPAMVYGMKRDRRKLHISLLHIPPEDFAQGGGSVGKNSVRSSAGRCSSTNTTTTMCGPDKSSPSSSSPSSMDF